MPTSQSHDEPRPADATAQAIGERVLSDAVQLAVATWGNRLLAAYALGSLAHGGFSPRVSDIDLGLLLRDPLETQDTHAVATLTAAVKSGGAPLADRLSIFWGTPATLTGDATSGRFPPLDRLDLKQYGRLLVGHDLRAQVTAPTQRELIVAGASCALTTLSTPEVTAQLVNPALLLDAGVRTLTKIVLFPVRFLFTARAGQVGRNAAAVEHFITHETGPAANLASAALAWRATPPNPRDPAPLHLLTRGLLPLYHIFLDDYATRLREYGESDTALALHEWRRRLA